MSKQFNIPIKIELSGSVSVIADSEEAAYDQADKIMFWAYQNGDPATHKDVSITDCEIEIDGEELDLDNDKWGDV